MTLGTVMRASQTLKRPVTVHENSVAHHCGATILCHSNNSAANNLIILYTFIGTVCAFPTRAIVHGSINSLAKERGLHVQKDHRGGHCGGSPGIRARASATTASGAHFTTH